MTIAKTVKETSKLGRMCIKKRQDLDTVTGAMAEGGQGGRLPPPPIFQ